MVILVVFNSFNVVKNLKKPNLVALQKPPFYTTHKRKFCSMPFFSHSLATAFWFGCTIAEHSITIIRLPERCLILIYNDKRSTFHELLKKDFCFYSH